MIHTDERVELRVWLEQRGVDWRSVKTLPPEDHVPVDEPGLDLSVLEPWSFPTLAEPETTSEISSELLCLAGSRSGLHCSKPKGHDGSHWYRTEHECRYVEWKLVCAIRRPDLAEGQPTLGAEHEGVPAFGRSIRPKRVPWVDDDGTWKGERRPA